MKARLSPSTSLPARTIFIGVSSITVTDCAEASGASLTAVIVIETVAGAEFSVPSLAVKVKLSGPL